jgi:hypothetical protein
MNVSYKFAKRKMTSLFVIWLTDFALLLIFFGSARMVTLYALVANQEFMIGALLVGMSSAILDVWHWRRWLHL